jgi:dGTPase
VRELFAAYLAAPQQLPAEHAGEAVDDGQLPRRVADYIAGMTDRFALREHHRLTGQRLFDDAPV